MKNSYSTANHKEIKIKITKKQLEKLLGEVDVHELPVDQVLSRLININNAAASDQYHNDHDHQQYQRSWRPHLQSIPEPNGRLPFVIVAMMYQ
ncbi:OLC1v1021205C1 [Oldenlandia corymbosa var. corymbosa]|uniref:OLC1v1021205C1 n=1 Tax=Oldenlandia corymbosa var. corymbosa TaxID=529605 RepID=A0AAV1BV55_OLDCO|nr:OLC1v1021205C1 [Oldenlandia corymbosa var. corymbosa]